MKNLKEDVKHTMHEDELASDSNMDKIYRCLYTTQKHLHLTSIEHNSIFALKSGKSNGRTISDGSANLYNHYDHESCKNMDLHYIHHASLVGNLYLF